MAKSKSTTRVPNTLRALEALVFDIRTARSRINVCAAALKAEQTQTSQEVFELLDSLAASELTAAIDRSERAIAAHARMVRHV